MPLTKFILFNPSLHQPMKYRLCSFITSVLAKRISVFIKELCRIRSTRGPSHSLSLKKDDIPGGV